MKTIQISRQICQLYWKEKHDLDYILSELLGMTDYKRCTLLPPLPVRFTDEMEEVSISNETFEALSQEFRGQPDPAPAAEILLWSNYFMGADL